MRRFVGCVLGPAGGGIARLAFRHPQQQRVDSWRERLHRPGDGVGTAYQIAYEALEIVDQPSLVADHHARLGLLQFDAARDSGHESLRVLGQAFEDTHQVAQHLMDFGDVWLAARGIDVGERLQSKQAARDVFQCNGLQFGAPAQRLYKDAERGLHGFPALRESIKEAGPVEVTQARDAGGIRLRLQVAPLSELRQRRVYLLDARSFAGPPRLGEYLVRPQLQAILPFRSGENVHDTAIEGSLLRADMAEKLAGICWHCSHS
jgi:hypothetical protein